MFAFLEKVDVVSGEKFMLDYWVHGRVSETAGLLTMANSQVSALSVARAGTAIVT